MEPYDVPQNDLFKRSSINRITVLNRCPSYSFGIQNAASKKNYTISILSRIFKMSFISFLYFLIEYIYIMDVEMSSEYRCSNYYSRKLSEKEKNKSLHINVSQQEDYSDKLWESYRENWRINVFIRNTQFLVKWLSFCFVNNVNEDWKNKWWAKWVEDVTDKTMNKYNEDQCDYKKGKGEGFSSIWFNNFIQEKRKSFNEFNEKTLQLWNKFLLDAEENLKNTETSHKILEVNKEQ